MLSKTLIKLIDYAIFPAVILIFGKIVSVIFLLKYFGIEYQVQGLSLSLQNLTDFYEVNTYSSLLMFTVVIAGLIWVTIKAHVFHETHITPSLSAKLYGMNLEEIIHDNETVFAQSFIWLSYSWLCTLMFGIHSYFGMSAPWLFYAAAGVSVIATALLAIDIERETQFDVKASDTSSAFKNSSVSLYDLRKVFE